MNSYTEIQGLLDGLRPVPRLTVSQWADMYRYLSTIASAMPGKYSTDRTPYMRKIMDCLSAHETYKKIVFMKGAQIGATEAGSNFIGYVMHISPAPIMMVQPTEEMVKKLSKGRIDTLVEACPELKERVATKKSRDGDNTITQKNFHGGTLFLAGANSAAGLRSVPVRFLVLDEVDAYPLDLDGEGSPIDLATARTRTFPNKKIFIISTPTISGMSVIEREFLETDQNYYHVPCPHCGGLQKLVFEQLKWDEGKPETAKYCCIHCGELIEERYKGEMLKNGVWIPEVPERSNYETIGFHLNSLYSPYGWQYWREIADDFIKSKNDQSKLKTFINTTLGETWAERGESPPYKNLYNRRESYRLNEIPKDVCFLTAGVDVQRDRIELEIVGWCADKRSYSIDYRVLEGDTAGTSVWNELAAVVSERWTRGDGIEFPVRLMAVDTGYNTSHVYAFCRRFDASRVVPVKGQDNLGMAVSPPKTVDVTKAGKRVGKLRQWNIGVSFLKSELYAALRLERDTDGNPPPGYCHFPEYDEHYFRGLTAEEHVKKVVRGFPRYVWQKVYERNEPLDCRVYARAAAVIVGLDRLSPAKLAAMGGIEPPAPDNNVAQTTDVKPHRPQREKRERRRSSFWDR
jgi:phage terminase large subunit GpA-like protein